MDEKKQKLRQMTIIRDLPYPELLEAHGIIEKGADVALLYFWYNLLKAMYYPAFSIDAVQKQAEYYCKRNPEFHNDIVKWFCAYERRVKEYGTDVRKIAHTPTVRNLI